MVSFVKIYETTIYKPYVRNVHVQVSDLKTSSLGLVIKKRKHTSILAYNKSLGKYESCVAYILYRHISII